MGVIPVPPVWRKLYSQDRGQAFSWDSLIGLLLLLGAATVVIFATGISPQEARQPQTQVLNEEIRSETQAALIASAQDGSLKQTILSWDDSEEEFSDGTTPTVRQGWYVEHPDNDFGSRLTWIEASHGVSINVRVVPGSNQTAPDTAPEPVKVIETITGQGDRLIVRKTVAIDEKDRLQSPAVAHSSSTTPIVATGGEGPLVSDASTYPVPEGASPHNDGRLYNTVTVEVVIFDV